MGWAKGPTYFSLVSKIGNIRKMDLKVAINHNTKKKKLTLEDQEKNEFLYMHVWTAMGNQAEEKKERKQKKKKGKQIPVGN